MSKNNQKNKKKKSPAPQQFMSAEEYIKTRVRSLPICKAFMSSIEDFKDSGTMSIFVVRKHNNDKYTSAMYYWTSYGKGFNNTEHFFRLEKEEQEELENLFVEKENAEETDYAIVHNFIYQAIRGEKEYDDEVVDACKSFKIDQYILAPENEFECKPLDIDFIAVAKKKRKLVGR